MLSKNEMIRKYTDMNKIAHSDGVVFFGSDCFCKMNMNELANSFNMSETLYNRSVKDLTVQDMEEYVQPCIIDLDPKRVFIEIGNTSINDSGLSVDELVAKYEWLLYTIHIQSKTKIYLVFSGNKGEHVKEVCKRLKALSDENGCEFIDITKSMNHAKPELKVFDQLKSYIRCKNISFFEAMNNVSID